MLTTRATATLLAACDEPSALRVLLSHLGFAGEPLPVSAALRESLAIDPSIVGAEIVAGRGALRAMALQLRDDAPASAVISSLVRRLVARSPHVLWLVAGVQHTPRTITLAVLRSGGDSPAAMLSLDRSRVVDSDAETFASLAAAHLGSAVDLAVHARWAELLGREALNRRFYRVLERSVRALADDARGGRTATARSETALLCSSRLLFLAFLQAKGWLDGDRAFLARTYDDCVATSGQYHRRVLRPLFFGTLNTPRRNRAPAARAFGRIPFLNGGLFAPAHIERGTRVAELGDASLGAFLHDVLGHYRFTAREDRATWSDAAVDPEMLGRAFESLMASRERRASGTFYTPSTFVARVADSALLGSVSDALPDGSKAAVRALAAGESPVRADCAHTLGAIASLAVLDPACGSGAFLVHALERLARWRTLAGDARSPDAIRRDLLSSSLFGVDRDPTAVWLCELRLWLAVAVECNEADPARVLPLPNLDRNIRVGDALAGSVNGAAHPVGGAGEAQSRMAGLRARYGRATGSRKLAAARAIDAAERAVAERQVERELTRVAHRRRDVLTARRERDLFGIRATTAALDRQAAALRAEAAALRRMRNRLQAGGALPFQFSAHFADVFEASGFTTIIGNPPWVRLHRIPPAERESLRERFTTLRHAAWVVGADAAGAGSGFAGQADLASLFVERSLALLRPGGLMALLLPAKLWTTLAGGGVRRLLHEGARILAVEDCTGARDLFDAVTYPSIVVAQRPSDQGIADGAGETEISVHRGDSVVRWRSPQRGLAFDESAGSPWLMLPPPARAAFDRLRRAGRTLVECGLARPMMGVKCGHNEAFLVTVDDGEDATSVADARPVHDRLGRRGMVEATMLRRVVRGEQVRAWRITQGAEHIVWTHTDAGAMRTLPPHAARWLAPHRARLVARTDARPRQAWWALHRVDGACAQQARVIWADMARAPRAAWLEPGDDAVPLNTCYVLRCACIGDAHAFTALLNSQLAAAWLRTVAEPARGGYRRLFAWTTALLPLPADWPRAREILAPLALAARDAPFGSCPVTHADLLDATCAAYRLRCRDIAPLLEWHPPAP